MRKASILVVDDEPEMLEVCRDALAPLGARVETEARSARAAERLGEGWDIVLFDLKMPAPDGMELLQRIRRVDPEAVVIMMTGHPTIDTAVEAIRRGAYDYVPKPFTPDQLAQVVERALERTRLREEHRFLERHVEAPHKFGELLSGSAAMRKVFELIRKVAATDTEVLILGESGTGKELAARTIHAQSARRTGRFVAVNCGAIPEGLMESEFFGHEKGAYTSAQAAGVGLFEYAHRGTLFLDEIGDLPPSLQAKLLRVLQERRCRRVGGQEEIPVDVRILAATNRDLEAEVHSGRLREDLYFRIHVVTIPLPPLRARREDIPMLAGHFLSRYAAEWGRAVRRIDAAAIGVLARYAWPGNVRELQNVIKRAVALTARETIGVDDLPDEVVEGGLGDADAGFFALRAARVSQFERSYLRELLERHRGDAGAAMAESQIPKATFYRLLKQHDLRPEQFRF